MTQKVGEFNKGKKRGGNHEYWRICERRQRAKKQARETGDWSTFKALTAEMLTTPATDSQDEHFRRMYYEDTKKGISGGRTMKEQCPVPWSRRLSLVGQSRVCAGWSHYGN